MNTKQVISTSLEALTMLIALQGIAAEFDAAQQAAYEKAGALRRAGDAAQQPYLGDVKTRCKNFMQQAHHAAGALLEIVQLFYPEIKKAPWDTLREKVGREIGEDDQFTHFLDKAVPFFELVLHARDCLEHKNSKGAVVKDFEVQPDGQLHPPTIEINFRGSDQPLIPVSEFMTGVITSIANGFEMMLAHLCNANTRPSPGFLSISTCHRRTVAVGSMCASPSARGSWVAMTSFLSVKRWVFSGLTFISHGSSPWVR